jgi:peroxiredoxin
MWHMPGHIFTRLKRYGDAAWQQEASARTDHAHMIAARILPEQIHNYAHNNDWLVENLSFIGRVRDAVDLAKNMIELPRMAPGALLVGKDGYGANSPGYTMGRKRLLDTLLAWGRWEELLSLENTRYLEPAEDPLEDARRLRALAVAAFQSGQKAKGEEKLATIEKFIKDLRDKRYADADKTETDLKKAGKSLDDLAKAVGDIFKKSGEKVGGLEKYRNEIRVYQALAENKPLADVKPLLDEAKDIAPLRASRIYLKLGDKAKALELAEKAAKDTAGQVLGLANLADVQWRADKKDEARKSFEKLRPLCTQADLGEIVFTRLKPIAEDLKLPVDWRPKLEWPADSGVRPELANLGPFRWHPYPAPDWEAVDQLGNKHSLAEYKGKPTLLVFYLGSGCSHCVEQLNALGPLTKEFTDAGIHIVAVSTDNAADLNKTFVQAKDAQGFSFPIVADPAMTAFKAYRAYDDFENAALHGTFLIDAAGRVRWQDISFKPFSNSKWLLGECKRLLALPGAEGNRVAEKGSELKSAKVSPEAGGVQVGAPSAGE